MDDSLSGTRLLLAAEYVGHGGTRSYVKELLRFYARHGASGVLLTSWSEYDSEMEALAGTAGFELLRYSDLVTGSGFGALHARPAVWSLQGLRQETRLFRDLVESRKLNMVTASVGTSGMFLSALNAVTKPIMIAHGYPHGRRQSLLGRLIHARLLPRSATIVTVSDFAANRFRKVWRTDRLPVAVVTLHSTTGELQPATQLADKERLILTAALVEDHKEPFDWIDATARVLRDHPEARAVWLGTGPLLDVAIQRARELDLPDSPFVGWENEVASWYRRARVYLQLSSTEALGLSVLDALRFGVPAVVTNAGGLPEVVIDGLNGFVVPVGDSKAAATAVAQLLDDEELWARQSASARRLYQERFAPSRWERSLLALHQGGKTR